MYILHMLGECGRQGKAAKLDSLGISWALATAMQTGA